jgi:C4-dicarboxylate-specific signal transduction histidine kinase
MFQPYAATATDRRLHLEASVDRGKLRFVVRDHGPGISKAGQKKLFQPFSKSVHEAAVSAPGVGLGLALCKRLARDLGGELRLLPATEGAEFELSLPTRGA